MKRLLIWCKQQQILRGEAGAGHELLPGLVPTGLRGEILAGPLNTVEGPGGIPPRSRPGHAFKPEHEELFRTLLEPFTVALENDRRLRN